MDIAFDRMHLYFLKGINYCINRVDKEYDIVSSIPFMIVL